MADESSGLAAIRRDALARAETIASDQELAIVRAEFVGKKGKLGLALRALGKLPKDERPAAGQRIHAIKGVVEEALERAATRLKGDRREKKLADGAFDVTLPGRRQEYGYPHPLRLVERDIIAAFLPLGFSVASGPLVEHDWYNFEALNIPKHHPARDMQDTFFVGPSSVLRTHTSNVQIRTMTRREPPLRILAPGMVFRHDEVDPTHSPVFHQVEGLWVDELVTFANLKWVLERFAVSLFGAAARLRFRPSFFPFTEPSAEVDVSCVACAGAGETAAGEVCRLCRGSGWLEILGAGMVDPAVLAKVGYDPERFQGFAFGAGVERIAMLRWGIDDIRLFYDNDLRFLRQFRAAAFR